MRIRAIACCAPQTSSPVEIEVVMTGRLIPDESIIYDFSHEEEGQGVIMPVVRIEQVDYVLVVP